MQLGEILQAKIINDYNTKVAGWDLSLDVRFIKRKLIMRHRLNAYDALSPYSVSSSSPSALQPILKGLPGDADHVADADRLERSGVGELIGRKR